MSLPVPFGAIVTVVKKCWSTLTQIMLIKTYQLSHERWAVRHRLGASWHSLEELFGVQSTICSVDR